MFVLGRPSDDKLAQVLDRVRGTPLTYGEVGATVDTEALPPGYHHMRATRMLGSGDAAFAAACDGIRTWQLHRGQGFRVVPADPPIEVGTEVVTDVPLAGPVHVLAACRVVRVMDEPDRFGFAYGTLRVHPARGEEAFVVERALSGEVEAVIVAFSRPRHPLMRLGAPIARRQQEMVTHGYLDALKQHVSNTTP
jgi:uncharacterized protein (UPF0548 family)